MTSTLSWQEAEGQLIERILGEEEVGQDFDSILVFSNQAEIPQMDLARLSDVGGDMVSSLASREDLRRKVERRIG